MDRSRGGPRDRRETIAEALAAARASLPGERRTRTVKKLFRTKTIETAYWTARVNVDGRLLDYTLLETDAFEVREGQIEIEFEQLYEHTTDHAIERRVYKQGQNVSFPGSEQWIDAVATAAYPGQDGSWHAVGRALLVTPTSELADKVVQGIAQKIASHERPVA